MNNLEEIRAGIYLCRSQAGFKKLLKQSFVKDGYYTFKEATEKLKNYPLKYPAIVIPDKSLNFSCGAISFWIVYPEDFKN